MRLPACDARGTLAWLPAYLSRWRCCTLTIPSGVAVRFARVQELDLDDILGFIADEPDAADRRTLVERAIRDAKVVCENATHAL